MKRYKTHSDSRNRRTHRSTDGFFRQGQASGPQTGGEFGGQGTLSDFKKADGFYSPQQIGSSQYQNRDNAFTDKPHPGDTGPVRRRRHRGHRPRLNFGRFMKRALSFALVTSLIGAGYIFGKAYLKAQNIFRGGGGAAALEENVDPTKLNGEGDGRVNILMLGKGGLGHEAPDLTDTILILSIDPVQKNAALLSIPRDLWVSTEDYGSMKINAVYANAKTATLVNYDDNSQVREAENAGFSALERVIHENIGIPIHYHAMVDFEGFKKAIDTIGGISFNVSSPVYEIMHLNGRPYLLDVRAGEQQFDGFRALAYVRSRYTSPRGDFDRSERQRLLLIALKEKIFSLGTFGNPVKINQLLDSFGDNVVTNLSVSELLRVYEIGGDITGGNVQSVGLADPPNDYVTTGSVGGQSVVLPRAGLGNFSEIQSFVRNTLKDGFLLNENATVAVLNGTSIEGLAGRTADELKSYGYNISQVDNSPLKDIQSTVLVDMRGGEKKYTRRYLEQRFGVQAAGSLPDPRIIPGNADFVIILGQNEFTRLQN